MLGYLIDFLIEQGANCENVIGVPELITGCLIWFRRDLIANVTIFIKFSLVFPRGNEKPQSTFYILENNTISTDHELNLSRF